MEREARPGIHTMCEDTHTLRLENKLSDLRVGYVHRHPLARCARDRFKSKAYTSKEKKKQEPTWSANPEPGIHTMCEDTHTLRLENKFSDLRVGYVHRHPLAQSARDRFKSKAYTSKEK